MKVKALVFMCCLVTTSLVSTPLGVALSGPSKPVKFIAAFNGYDGARHLEAKAPDYIHYEVLHPSPDGKYVAQVTVADAEITTITIYRKRAGRQRFVKREAVSPAIEGAGGGIWVPRHPHTLAYATGSAYSWGSLGLWDGGKKVRILRRGKGPEEGFSLRGA
ncbi:hypothetical protein EON80_21535, partial [bacterium]